MLLTMKSVLFLLVCCLQLIAAEQLSEEATSCHHLPISVCKESCFCGTCNSTVCISVDKHGRPKHHSCETLETNYGQLQCDFYFDYSHTDSSSGGISDAAVTLALGLLTALVLIAFIILVRILCCMGSTTKSCIDCCRGRR